MRYAPKCAVLSAALLIFGGLAARPVQGSTVYALEIFTNNGAYADDPDVSLTLELSQEGELARFDLSNDSAVQCTISAVYFEQGSLLAFDSLLEGPGTVFSWPASSGSLSSGNLLAPPFDAWFSADADPPPSQNGIDPGESVVFLFQTSEGVSTHDIGNQLLSGDLRVGAHVIAFPDGSSEVAVSTPEPSTVLLLLLGGSLMIRSRRRRHASAS